MYVIQISDKDRFIEKARELGCWISMCSSNTIQPRRTLNGTVWDHLIQIDLWFDFADPQTGQSRWTMRQCLPEADRDKSIYRIYGDRKQTRHDGRTTLWKPMNSKIEKPIPRVGSKDWKWKSTTEFYDETQVELLETEIGTYAIVDDCTEYKVLFSEDDDISCADLDDDDLAVLTWNSMRFATRKGAGRTLSKPQNVRSLNCLKRLVELDARRAIRRARRRAEKKSISDPQKVVA